MIRTILSAAVAAFVASVATLAPAETWTDDQERKLATYRNSEQMRDIGICLWRDAVHQMKRDDVWTADVKFRGQMHLWCGREPELKMGGKRP